MLFSSIKSQFTNENVLFTADRSNHVLMINLRDDSTFSTLKFQTK